MTDISKYKNVSLSHKTYEMIDALRKQLVENTILSRSQTISILVTEKTKKLNGKTEYWYDGVHSSKKGSEKIAKIIYEDFYKILNNFN